MAVALSIDEKIKLWDAVLTLRAYISPEQFDKYSRDFGPTMTTSIDNVNKWVGDAVWENKKGVAVCTIVEPGNGYLFVDTADDVKLLNMHLLDQKIARVGDVRNTMRSFAEELMRRSGIISTGIDVEGMINEELLILTGDR